MVDGLENFEDGGDAFALLVEDEGAVFHAAGGEEGDVARAREFLRRPLRLGGRGPRRVVVVIGGGVVVRCNGGVGGDGANGIKVVCDEAFVRDEDEEGKLLEDGELGDPIDVDGAEPAAGVVAIRNIYTKVSADSDHGIAVWLVEVGGTVDAGTADGVGARLAGEAGFYFFDGAVEGCAWDIDAFG